MFRRTEVATKLFKYEKVLKNVQFNSLSTKPEYKLVHKLPFLFWKNVNTPSGTLFFHDRVYTPFRYFYNNVTLFALSEQEIKKYMDGISDKFGEAMELLSDARSSMGTVYFSDDMTDAEAVIDEVLTEYESLLKLLTDSQSKDVTRAIGLKMEELKAQLQLLKESIKD